MGREIRPAQVISCMKAVIRNQLLCGEGTSIVTKQNIYINKYVIFHMLHMSGGWRKRRTRKSPLQNTNRIPVFVRPDQKNAFELKSVLFLPMPLETLNAAPPFDNDQYFFQAASCLFNKWVVPVNT